MAMATRSVLIHRTGDIDGSVEALLNVRPEACPNPVISMHADELLGLDGRLFEASEMVANKHMLDKYGMEIKRK